MRKLIIQVMITIDGFFEGKNRDMSWHNVDGEFNEYAIDLLNNTGVLLFGRVTYHLMAGYWPTEQAKKNDPIVAGLMNSLPKIVFSTTLENVTWNNTRLVQEHIVEEISDLKRQPGKDLTIFGSSDLTLTCLRHGLIDELRVFISPVVLGSGKRLFEGIKDNLTLKLVSSRAFRSGNVLLCYQPELNGTRKKPEKTDYRGS